MVSHRKEAKNLLEKALTENGIGIEKGRTYYLLENEHHIFSKDPELLLLMRDGFGGVRTAIPNILRNKPITEFDFNKSFLYYSLILEERGKKSFRNRSEHFVLIPVSIFGDPLKGYEVLSIIYQNDQYFAELYRNESSLHWKKRKKTLNIAHLIDKIDHLPVTRTPVQVQDIKPQTLAQEIAQLLGNLANGDFSSLNAFSNEKDELHNFIYGILIGFFRCNKGFLVRKEMRSDGDQKRYDIIVENGQEIVDVELKIIKSVNKWYELCGQMSEYLRIITEQNPEKRISVIGFLFDYRAPFLNL